MWWHLRYIRQFSIIISLKFFFWQEWRCTKLKLSMFFVQLWFFIFILYIIYNYLCVHTEILDVGIIWLHSVFGLASAWFKIFMLVTHSIMGKDLYIPICIFRSFRVIPRHNVFVISICSSYHHCKSSNYKSFSQSLIICMYTYL